MNMSLEKPGAVWYESLPHSGEVYSLIYQATSGATKNERLDAVATLGKGGDPRAVRPLIDLLGDPDPEIRVAVIGALGELKSGRSAEALTGLLRDRREPVAIRQQAAAALAAIRSTGAVLGLEEFVADEDEDPAIREFAGFVLNGNGNRQKR